MAGTTISSSAVNDDFNDIATALTGSVAADGQTTIAAPLKFPSGTAANPSHTFLTEMSTGMYLSAAGIIGFSGAGVAAVLMDSTRVGVGKDGNQLVYGNTAILCPVGSMIDFAGTSAPAGWLFCAGQAVSRTGYPELFTALGTTWGTGNGTTTFNVPDLRGRVTAGRDDMGGSAANRITTAGSGIDGVTIGAAGGAQSVTLDATMIPAHTHTSPAVNDPGHFHQMAFKLGVTGGGSAEELQNSPSTGFYVSGTSTTGITLAATTGSTGGGAAHANVQPTAIVNKIIFAGRP